MVRWHYVWVFCQIKSLQKSEIDWIISARGNGYLTIEDVWRRAGTPPHILATLAEADAFIDMGIDRRKALWDAKSITSRKTLPLFEKSLEGENIKELSNYVPKKNAYRRAYSRGLRFYAFIIAWTPAYSFKK